MEQEGCIISYWGDETQGGWRKYYRITEEGKALYEQSKSDWNFAKDVLDKLIKGGLEKVDRFIDGSVLIWYHIHTEVML